MFQIMHATFSITIKICFRKLFPNLKNLTLNIRFKIVLNYNILNLNLLFGIKFLLKFGFNLQLDTKYFNK